MRKCRANSLNFDIIIYMNPQTFVFIGRSGCGKGTQAKLLQDVLKEKNPDQEIFYIETGANFRKFLGEEKQVGLLLL